MKKLNNFKRSSREDLPAPSAPTDTLKFVFYKMGTKIDKIFTVDLTLCSNCQIYGEDFVNFCGLLKKYELYTELRTQRKRYLLELKVQEDLLLNSFWKCWAFSWWIYITAIWHFWKRKWKYLYMYYVIRTKAVIINGDKVIIHF